jgi:hypothetical protein
MIRRVQNPAKAQRTQKTQYLRRREGMVGFRPGNGIGIARREGKEEDVPLESGHSHEPTNLR